MIKNAVQWFKKKKSRCVVGGAILLAVIIMVFLGKFLYDKFKDADNKPDKPVKHSVLYDEFIISHKGDKNNINKTDEQKKIFNIGVSSIPFDNKPHIHDNEAGRAVSKLVYEPLIDVKSDMTVSLKLANSLDFSDDGLSAELKLRETKFSDGKSVTAEDVKNAYMELCSSESEYYDKLNMCVIDGMQEYIQGSANDIRGIECIDQNIVKFTFKTVSAENMLALALPVIKQGEDDIYALGTGPYKVSSIVSANRIELDINSLCDENPYGYESIVLKSVPLNVLEDDISNYELDMMYTDSGSNADLIKQTNYHNIYLSRGENYYYIGFNFSSEKSNDINLRKAVALSIDREDLTESFYVFENKAFPLGITSPYKSSDNYSDKIGVDKKKAKSSLKLASSDCKELIYICHGDAYSYGIYEQLRTQLEKSGIKLDIQTVDDPEYDKALYEGNSEIGDLYISSTDSVSAVKLIENIVKDEPTLNKEYEDMLKKAYKDNPQKLYENIEDFCCDNLLLIPVVSPCSSIAVSADCDNELMLELFK